MEQNRKTKQMGKAAVIGCLCLLAVGTGVVVSMEEKPPVPAEQKEMTEQREAMEQAKPAAAAKTAPVPKQKESGTRKPQKPEPLPEETETAEPVFAYPVQGNVVQPYSMEHAIYDPTLEQYRTSSCIRLAAEQGEFVQAAEAGIVKEIGEHEEKGRTVTLEHKNGWLTTYGQLGADLRVSPGERVKKGQVIGSVTSPTKYGTALGSHLLFEMQKDGAYVDPEKNLRG